MVLTHEASAVVVVALVINLAIAGAVVVVAVVVVAVVLLVDMFAPLVQSFFHRETLIGSPTLYKAPLLGPIPMPTVFVLESIE